MNARSITIFLLAAALALTGCETIQENKGAAVGAGVGGAAGAVMGGDTGGAIAGGLLGALIGGAVGHYAYDKQQDRDETAQAKNYSPSQGTVLTIEDTAVDPSTVRPGESVDIEMTYAILSPEKETKTKLTEIREIRRDGELVGRLETSVTHEDGTYTSSVPIELPETAEAGTYEVVTTVQTPTETATERTQFKVG